MPPVILLTNLAHDPVIKEAMQTGARSYLIKADLTPDQVVNKVKEILK
jgi:DNA-binding NarL/FixJ family response regulator